MAKISSDHISKVEKNSRMHEGVECTYNIFSRADHKYIQFDTYGTSSRTFKDKTSQSIQFDESTAKFIIGVLKKEFNIS